MSIACQSTDISAEIYAQSIAKVDEFSVVRTDFDTALSNGQIQYVPQELYFQYKQVISSLDYCSLDDFSVVYSPLNGAGYKIVPEVLTQKGVIVNIVEEQAFPDGNFPTCPYPNPEKKEALTLALAKAKQINAPLLIATDPDCDRVGIAVLIQITIIKTCSI